MPDAHIVRTRIAVALSLCALVTMLAMTGCSKQLVEYVDQGTVYTRTDVSDALGAGDSKAEGASVGDAQDLRRAAIVSLRNAGGDEAKVADLLTATFPATTLSVPVYVEKATFEEKDVWVIVEVVGPKDGELKDRRLWVLSPAGDVLFSAMR